MAHAALEIVDSELCVMTCWWGIYTDKLATF